MIKNYFKTALRILFRNKGYSILNITGLAIGMACCLLILMFVNNEVNYDTYNKNADRIFRVAMHFKYGGRDSNAPLLFAPMAKTLSDDYPEIEDVVRFRPKGSHIVTYGENSFNEKRFIYCDNSLFNVFTIPLLKGNPATALKDPNTLVISRKTAEKYFPHEDPLGKTVRIDNKEDYKVTGVFEEIPRQSHFHYDVIASLESLPESRENSWLSANFYTYLLLRRDADTRALEAGFPEFTKKYIAPQFEKALGQSFESLVASGNMAVEFFLQPLSQIYLHSDLVVELEPVGDIRYIYIFSAIAIFVLIIASVNFMNLSTARSIARSREVGIRKALGSGRGQLIRQFLGESVILAFISMLLSWVLVILAIPYFNALSGNALEIRDLLQWKMVAAAFAVMCLTGLLAGLYPAFLISAFSPAGLLKTQLKTGVRKSLLRSGLVIFQFTASIILIISTLVVMQQLDYIRQKDLGFDKHRVLILKNANLLGKQAETFKKEMLKYPQLKSATISSFLPVPSRRISSAVFPEGDTANKNSTSMQNWIVDYDYIKTLGMKIVEGRDFSREFPTDAEAVIINQCTAREFGWPDPIGKRLSIIVSPKGDTRSYIVIGVVEDFHFASLKKKIAPVLMLLGETGDLISFRCDTTDITGTIALMREKWNTFLPGQPFEYSFLDELFNDTYKSEQRLGEILGIFTLLAIFVACLGLVGLATFTSEQRTKEIGIRKVLGASVPGIIRLLNREFVILVTIANGIAWPLAYLIMNKWLQAFAYRPSFKMITFLTAAAAAIIIALLTTSYQAIKASLANPVQSLKYE